MSDNDKQNLLLSAIDTLQARYECLPTPCIALLIAKNYRLLAAADIAIDQQQGYVNQSSRWLNCYIHHARHSQQMQHYLHELIHHEIHYRQAT